jgi:hypothetical protein
MWTINPKGVNGKTYLMTAMLTGANVLARWICSGMIAGVNVNVNVVVLISMLNEGHETWRQGKSHP